MFFDNMLSFFGMPFDSDQDPWQAADSLLSPSMPTTRLALSSVRDG